ncbi:MAG: hypothetical protein M3490_03380, partial [Chloroflexota bacterium]|nr:hypothetical protein [Chloroflexota bacterium]
MRPRRRLARDRVGTLMGTPGPAAPWAPCAASVAWAAGPPGGDALSQKGLQVLAHGLLVAREMAGNAWH